MKTWLSLVLCVCAATVCLGQTAMLESQKQALAKYPALADAKSKLNQKFLELLTAQRASDASYLQRDDWPLQIADRAAKALDVKPVLAHDGKPHTTTLDQPVGRVTIHGEVIQRMDDGLLIATQRGKVLLRGFDAKEGKTITVPAMAAEPYNYIDTEGAKRLVDGYQAMK